MFTHTHALVAAVVSQYLPVRGKDITSFCIVGSILPDIPLLAHIALKIANEEALYPLVAGSSKLTLLLENSLHSLALWAAPAIALVLLSFFPKGRNFWRAFAAMIGVVVCHILVDAMTHRTFGVYSINYTYPIESKVHYMLSIWDYAPPRGTILPRWQELVLDAALVGVLYLRRNKKTATQPCAAVTTSKS